MAIVYNKKNYRGRLTNEERAKIIEQTWNFFVDRMKNQGSKKIRMIPFASLRGTGHDCWNAAVSHALQLYDTFATNHENEERDGLHEGSQQ